MALQPVFTAAQITIIGANAAGTGFNSQQIMTDGMSGYRAWNTTGAWLYVCDENGALIDVLPPVTYREGGFKNKTRWVWVTFDPARSGGTGAFTTNNAWQAYLEPLSQTPKDAISATAI